MSSTKKDVIWNVVLFVEGNSSHVDIIMRIFLSGFLMFFLPTCVPSVVNSGLTSSRFQMRSGRGM